MRNAELAKEARRNFCDRASSLLIWESVAKTGR